MIKPADKGGNVVIMNVENYETMCLDILRKIGIDPFQKA